MVQQEGPATLWRGLLPTMLRDVPFSAVYWMGYEKVKHHLNTKHHDTLSNFQTAFLAGASSGMVSHEQWIESVHDLMAFIIDSCSLDTSFRRYQNTTTSELWPWCPDWTTDTKDCYYTRISWLLSRYVKYREKDDHGSNRDDNRCRTTSL